MNSITLKYKVTNPKPNIKCTFVKDLPFPNSVYHGELVPVLIKCENKGSVSAYQCRVRINNPQFVSLAILDHKALSYIVFFFLFCFFVLFFSLFSFQT